MSDFDEKGALGRFLTLADISLILNIPVGDVLELVRTGELPALKITPAGSWRVERTMLESYITAKYEESRRLALWQQSEAGTVNRD
jgi:hypothetical protein